MSLRRRSLSGRLRRERCPVIVLKRMVDRKSRNVLWSKLIDMRHHLYAVLPIVALTMFATLAICQPTPDQQTQKSNEGGQSSAASGVNTGGPHAAILDDQHRPITAGGFVKT